MSLCTYMLKEHYERVGDPYTGYPFNDNDLYAAFGYGPIKNGIIGEIYRKIASKLDVEFDDPHTYDYTCYKDSSEDTISTFSGGTWPVKDTED
jgi:hypothetical protein